MVASLSLDAVAEGIKKPAEKAVLEHLCCPEGQGYLFARPLPAEEIHAWVAAHRQTHRLGDLFDALEAAAGPAPQLLLAD